MKITCINSVQKTFSSKKTFKKHFDKCTYSDENFEAKDTKTVEHIKPVSQGGQNVYSNYLVVKRSWNMKRSSIPLADFIETYPQIKENIVKTVNAHDGEIIEGINWAEEVKKTLYDAIGYDIFRN